jgi:tRNA A37 N6-isopentenylltransferase MiaA
VLAELEAFLAGPGSRPTRLAKADGVAEFGAFIKGEIDLDTAKGRTVLKVRRYAKRQRTFFRGQLGHALPAIAAVADAGSIEPLAEDVLARLASGTSGHAPC